jgi:hypothetical protein
MSQHFRNLDGRQVEVGARYYRVEYTDEYYTLVNVESGKALRWEHTALSEAIEKGVVDLISVEEEHKPWEGTW